MATLIDAWAGRGLPSLQQTRERLQPLMRRPERASPAEVADIVLRDPLMTAQVLRAANQRIRSGLAADVVSIESAVMLFGVAPFFDRFCRGPTVEETLGNDAARLQAFIAATREVRFAARLARDYAYRRFDARLDEIHTAALLSGVPRLLALLDGQPASDAPEQLLALLTRWQLPEVLVMLNRDEAEPTPRQLLQRASLQLARTLPQGWWQPATTQSLLQIAEMLQCGPDQAWDMLVRLVLDFARRDEAHGQPFLPARHLPLLPGPWPDPAAARTRAIASRPPAAPPPKPAAPPQAVPNIMNERLQALQRAGRERAAANHIMSLAVRALAEGLSMQRIMLALLTPDGSVLRTRFCHGAAEQDPLRRFALSLATPSLFSRLLTRPQCVRVDVPYRGELRALMSEELVRQLGPAAFCAMSLAVHDKPLGILFADRARPLDEVEYRQLRQLCQLTSAALTTSASAADA